MISSFRSNLFDKKRVSSSQQIIIDADITYNPFPPIAKQTNYCRHKRKLDSDRIRASAGTTACLRQTNRIQILFANQFEKSSWCHTKKISCSHIVKASVASTHHETTFLSPCNHKSSTCNLKHIDYLIALACRQHWSFKSDFDVVYGADIKHYAVDPILQLQSLARIRNLLKMTFNSSRNKLHVIWIQSFISITFQKINTFCLLRSRHSR